MPTDGASPLKDPKRANAVVSSPVTVAVSAIELPTVAEAGVWLVLIAGVAGVIVTGSDAAPLLTETLLLSPL